MNWADPVLPFHLGAYAGLLGLGLWLSRRRKACISGRRVVVVPDLAPRPTVDLGRELPRIFARAALPEPSVPAGAPLLNPLRLVPVPRPTRSLCAGCEDEARGLAGPEGYERRMHRLGCPHRDARRFPLGAVIKRN